MIALPVVKIPAAAKTRAWRSLPHLNQEEDYAAVNQEEFLPGAGDGPGSESRRHFLQLLGASMALAGLSACRRPVERIMPFADQPEERIPGVPLYYATAMPLRGSVQPVLVKSHDGRPTKVEPNPKHPTAAPGTSVFAQASILSLYDPDRSRYIRRGGSRASWDDFLALAQRLGRGNRRVAVLAGETTSPTILALRDQLVASFPNASWVTYRPEGDNNEALGLQTAFGQRLRAQYHFDEAEVIVSLDADFLGAASRNATHAAQSFAKGRRLSSPGSTMSRLYVVESAYTTTGSMADHRHRMAAADIGTFANSIAAELGIIAPEFAVPDAAAQAIADDLQRAGTRGVILAGEHQPVEVHALCAAINSTLNGVGTTVSLLALGDTPDTASLSDLIEDMHAGEVDVLLMLGVNPVYDAPPALNFTQALSRVGDSIHVGMHEDETAQKATWHIPAAHYLEAWGDGRAFDGTQSVLQPLIAPLYAEAKSHIEVLGALVDSTARSGYDLVRATWQETLGTPFETRWRKVVHDGFLSDTGYSAVTPPVEAVRAANAGYGELDVVFRLDPTLLDGRFANNAWCQELPDPVTKIVWDNVAVMSPQTAAALQVTAKYKKGRYEVDRITLSAGGQSVELPIWIMPGHADRSISVSLGYGRTLVSHRAHRKTPIWDTGDKTDIYGQGALCTGVGQNVSVLRDERATAIRSNVAVTPTGRKYRIVTTQDHGVLDVTARPLVRIATLDEYRDNPAFVLDHEAPTPGQDQKTRFEDYPTLWEDQHPERSAAIRDSSYYRNQWGMTIDLNACNGCNACIVACQAENNVQVVGKTEVGNGRELHWLRLDRYFISHGDENLTEAPQMVLQPMPCQHCENAPCESVCPVAATVHSPDGTNQMIYNRCIGTRYCANNCPYKVRRYNFFNWSKHIPPTVQMAQNPNVSVRFRGVMEKCSFCIQRIRGAQKQAKLEDRLLARDEVSTACQDACAADAIVFGDLNDAQSQVSLERRNARSYTMLAELNIRPRVSYLARVRNPNSELEPA